MAQELELIPFFIYYYFFFKCTMHSFLVILVAYVQYV